MCICASECVCASVVHTAHHIFDCLLPFFIIYDLFKKEDQSHNYLENDFFSLKSSEFQFSESSLVLFHTSPIFISSCFLLMLFFSRVYLPFFCFVVFPVCACVCLHVCVCKELLLKDEECERLSKVRDQLGQELEELTASLFQVGPHPPAPLLPASP